VPETTDTPPAETIEAKPAQTVDKDPDAADEEQAHIALTQAFEEPGKEWLTRTAAVKNGDTLLPALSKLDTDHLNRISEFCKTFKSTVSQHGGEKVPTKHKKTPFTSVGQAGSDDESSVDEGPPATKTQIKVKKEPLDKQTVLKAEAKTKPPLKTSEPNEVLQAQPEAQQDAVVEEAPEGKDKVTAEVKGNEQKYLQRQEPEGQPRAAQGSEGIETPAEPSEEEVSELFKMIGDAIVEEGLEAPDKAKAEEDGDGDSGDADGGEQEVIDSAKGDGGKPHSSKKLQRHRLGGRVPAPKGTDSAEQNIESLLSMKRVTGRKSEVKKLVCEFVEQTAIELAKRSYAATYCHITGDTHSQLIKQRIAGMIAGTEAAVANVMNNADIEQKLGYMPGHWREVNERVTEAWDAMALGDTAGFITVQHNPVKEIHSNMKKFPPTVYFRHLLGMDDEASRKLAAYQACMLITA
jgi:hypothetical protein